MNDNDTLQIELQPIGKRVRVARAASILEAARQAGVDLASACGGEGNCGQCQVVLLEGQTAPITPDEEFILSTLELENGIRLACCAQALSDLKIQGPKLFNAEDIGNRFTPDSALNQHLECVQFFGNQRLVVI